MTTARSSLAYIALFDVYEQWREWVVVEILRLFGEMANLSLVSDKHIAIILWHLLATYFSEALH